MATEEQLCHSFQVEGFESFVFKSLSMPCLWVDDNLKLWTVNRPFCHWIGCKDCNDSSHNNSFCKLSNQPWFINNIVTLVSSLNGSPMRCDVPGFDDVIHQVTVVASHLNVGEFHRGGRLIQFIPLSDCYANRSMNTLANKLDDPNNDYALLQYLINHVQDVIWVYNLSLERFTFVSPSVFEMRGYTSEEVMSQPFFDAFTPSSRLIVENALSQEVNKYLTGQISTYVQELQQYCKDGSLVWIEVICNLRRNDHNQLEVIGVSRNVSERHEAESIRHELEQRYHMLADITSEGILIHQNGIIVDVNNALMQLFNAPLDASNFIGKSIFDFLPAFEADKVLLYMDENYSGVYQLNLNRADGSVIPVEITVKFIDINGIRYRVASITDITERKRNEQVLIDALELNRSIVLTSPVGILSTNSQGDIVFANTMASKIFRLDPNNIEVLSYFSPKWQYLTVDGEPINDCDLPFNIVQKEGRAVFGVRHAVVWPDGQKVIVSVNAVPLLSSGNEFCGMVATIEDITEKLEVEKQLLQTNLQLNELNSSKDRFFSVIAHDLRGAVGNIRSLAEYLVGKSVNNPDDEYKMVVNTLYDSSQVTFSLLQNLLAWAYSQRQAVSLHIETVNLLSLIDETVRVLQSVVNEKQISLKFDVNEALVCSTDKLMLSTILRNLVANAIKYSFKGSEVLISARLVASSSVLEIVIRDYGVGMPKSTIDDLLSNKTHQSTLGTANETGSGLGVNFSLEFLSKLGGDLVVESIENKGSVFTLSLPQ